MTTELGSDYHFVRVRDVHTIEKMQHGAQRHIPAYRADSWRTDEAARRRGINIWFPAVQARPVSLVGIAAIVPRSRKVVGVALVESMDYRRIRELPPETIRKLLRHHYMLAALYVPGRHQHQGIGRALFHAAMTTVADLGGVWLDGFVDERTDALGFYKKTGAWTSARNTGIPPRSPTNVEVGHHGPAGNWFCIRSR